MIFEHENYRNFLKASLIERIQANPSYSLRAMAKYLGFSCSQLSEVMNGKAGFSANALHKIAMKFDLSDLETEYLLLLREIEAQKDSEIRDSLIRRSQRLNPGRRPIRDLSIDYFKQISEWYHSAILELIFVKDFRFTAENISRTLGITKIEAELAIDRLVRLELLTKDKIGNFRRQNPDLQVRSPEKSAAMRKFYRQMMEKASQALDEQDPEMRWSGYETIPVAKEAMPKLRAACDEFCENLIRISNKYPNKSHVYHLSLHFFRLTKGRKKRNEI